MFHGMGGMVVVDRVSKVVMVTMKQIGQRDSFDYSTSGDKCCVWCRLGCDRLDSDAIWKSCWIEETSVYLAAEREHLASSN